MGSPGPIGDPECIVDELLARFGPGGLANVEGSAILALELNGDAILALERAPEAFPAQMDMTGFELKAQGMDQVIGQY